ncbi:MAG TPA: carboxypeptidase-like regulatory domain-containing protein [Blastocatellia bacterium]|nr:carboxypeptidase-like regulatory domain-containing protein [Blastocatellia bacterium]
MLRLIARPKRSFVYLLFFPFLVSTLFAGIPAKAQTTSGTVVGRVFDEQANPLSGAKVTFVSQTNGNTRATTTDASGSYVMPFLPVAVYSITASLDGYRDGTVQARVPLNATTEIKAPDITLRAPSSPPVTTPATPATSPADSDFTTLLNKTSPARGGNLPRVQVESLPLGGTTDMRSFDELALLLPGVLPPPYTPGVRGPGVGFGIGTAGQFSVNGLRARSNNFTVDGSDNNDPDVGVRRQGFVILVPQSIESIEEFQVSTLLWNSELGRNIGSQVNAVSKDGPNEYHGQLYGFFTDSSLNARNFFDYTGGPSGDESPFTRTQAGFVLGGPIVKNRTQFFGSFEQDVVNTAIEEHFATPAADERRFLGIPRFGVLQPFPGSNPLLVFDTQRGATPLGANMLSFYPLPNNPGGPYGANTFTKVLPASGEGSVFSFKVTQQISPNNSFNARYNFTDDNRILPSVNRAINSSIESDTRTQNLSLILDSALSPLVFNQARFSYGRTRLDFLELPESPFIFSASSMEMIGGVPGLLLSTTGPIGELIIEPFSPIGVDAFTFPQARANNTFQFADSISWTLGSHSIKAGADIRRVHLNSRLARNYRPRVVFGNTVASFGVLDQTNPSPPFPFVPESDDLLLLPGSQLATIGQPSSIFQTLTTGVPDPTIGLRFTEYNFFFNDNWRVRPNLTVDYGIRYEYNSVPREVSGRIERALLLEGLPSPGSSPADTPQRTSAFNSAVDAYRRILDGRDRIYQPDRNNFGPHVGFAYSPGIGSSYVIRGGYGVYFDTILGAVVSQSRNVFPNEIPLNIAPALISFDVLVLNNPAFLSLIDGPGGRPLNQPIPLIAPGTSNMIGGTSADLPALLGQFFGQNVTVGGARVSDNGFAFTLPENRLRTPYAQHWHLTLERQLLDEFLLSAAYVGTKGTKLTRLTTPNLGPTLTPVIPVATGVTIEGRPPVPFPPGFPPALVISGGSLVPDRPLPALGPFQTFENSASSIYHSLQLEARKRFSRGYSFTLSYTYGHAIDDVSDIFPISGAPVLPQDSFNFHLERASANYDVRHRLAGSLLWDLPFYRNSTDTAARLLGGWQLATIIQAHTGQPFTLNLPIDANLDGNLTDRPSTTEGLTFFEGHGRQRVDLAPGRRAADFVVLGQNGFVGRNTVRGDSFINWDLALNKSFRFTESQELEFRAEFFNVLNRANFGLPIRTLGNPGFGSAVDTITPARRIQFALKYIF